MHAYENALSELLTKLDAVESYGFKMLETRMLETRGRGWSSKSGGVGELGKKVIRVLGVGEKVEEKVGGLIE